MVKHVLKYKIKNRKRNSHIIIFMIKLVKRKASSLSMSM